MSTTPSNASDKNNNNIDQNGLRKDKYDDNKNHTENENHADNKNLTNAEAKVNIAKNNKFSIGLATVPSLQLTPLQVLRGMHKNTNLLYFLDPFHSELCKLQPLEFEGLLLGFCNSGVRTGNYADRALINSH